MEQQQEIIEAVARTVAREVVQEQAPNRKKEHEDVAYRIIKLLLIITIAEIGIYSSFSYYLSSSANNRIDCLSQGVTELEHEHISSSDWLPKRSCN